MLFGPYLLGVELVSMLLLAGIVGAYHLGWSDPGERETVDAIESDQATRCCWRRSCSDWGWPDCWRGAT